MSNPYVIKPKTSVAKIFWCINLALIVFMAGLQVGIWHGRRIEALDNRFAELQRQALRDSETALDVQPQAMRPDPCPVTIYAYAPVRRCTDTTPHITASNKRVRPGMIAVSRDVERDLGMQFGDRVHIYGLGTFDFQDRMHRRYTRSVDVLLPTVKQCQEFGVKSGMLAVAERAGQGDIVAMNGE